MKHKFRNTHSTFYFSIVLLKNLKKKKKGLKRTEVTNWYKNEKGEIQEKAEYRKTMKLPQHTETKGGNDLPSVIKSTF